MMQICHNIVVKSIEHSTAGVADSHPVRLRWSPTRIWSWWVATSVGFGLWDTLPHGDNSLADVGGHVGNVGPSMLLGGIGAAAAGKLATVLPGEQSAQRARNWAAVAGIAVAALANTISETRLGHSLHLFPPSHGNFNDALYGQVSGTAAGFMVRPAGGQPPAPAAPGAPPA